MSYTFRNADRTKFDGIETGATADQTGAEIKVLYEAESDTNALTDALLSKLNGIETSATADQTGAEIKALYEAEADTNAYDDAAVAKLAGIEASADVTDATNVAAAGAVMNTDTTTVSMSFVIDEDTMASNSDTKVPTQQSVKAYIDNKVTSSVEYKGGYAADTNVPDLDVSPSGVTKGDMYTVTSAGTFFTVGVEVGDVLIAEVNSASLEADWTIVNKNLDDASIKVAYENNSDTNAFTDAYKTKLDGIEASADVTDATNVAAAGAVMNTDSTTVSMSFVLDEDTMASDSNTKLATQQSIKAYVDSSVQGLASDVVSKTDSDSPYTASLDQVILCDATSAGITVNLPTAASNSGRKIIVKKVDSSGNTISIIADGSDLIDGAASQTITVQYDSKTLVCNGTNWYII